jgi:primosomal protein N' (replication factor Y)
VQSFQPDATPLRYAARHDVAGFLAEELGRRRELGYPPFRHLISIVAAGPDADAPTQLLREVQRGLTGADLLGPAPLLRLRGRHRAQLVAKTERPRALAARAAQLLAAAAPAMRRAGVTAVVDVDPQSL